MANDQETEGPGEPAMPVNQGAAAQGEEPKVIPDAVAADKAGQAAAGAESQDEDEGASDDGAGAAPDQPRVQPTPPEPEVPANVTLSSNPEVKVDGNIAAEIEDALTLLEFGIASGFMTTAGKGIPNSVVEAIKRTHVKARTGSVTLAEWINLETNYHWLAAVLAPVSAETLKNTRESPGKASPARHFTRSLWIWTGMFAMTIILVELGQKVGGMPETPSMPSDSATRKEMLDSLMHFGLLIEPYAYGGLGACAYLLRSAHMYLYTRTFDLRRRSEYYNRIILGLVAGGAIFLFINSNAGDESTAVQLSSGALAFIAGYSNDFLFSAIQRIVNAIFPKTEGDRPIGSPRAPADVPSAVPSPLPQGGQQK